MATSLMQMTRLLPQDTLRHLAGVGVDRLRTAISAAHVLPMVPGCTLGLWRDPYRFVMKNCARLGSEAFQGRLMFRRTIFLMGEDAAVLFYNPQLFQRAGAQPLRLPRTLFGIGGIQSLDGAEHRRRKALFLDLLAGPAAVQQFGELAGQALRAAAARWPEQQIVDFYAEIRRALTRAACAWAGLPLADDEVDQRCEQLSAVFDPAHIVGPSHWRSWWKRRQAERWCERVLADYQAGRRTAPEDSALHAFSHYRDSNGQALASHQVAVELLNVIRPVVAVAVYAVHILHALETHPHYREQLREDDAFLPLFVQEVRRFYPLFSQVAARTREAFEWNGLRFPAGVRVMLDLYGTNHDVRAWEAPDVFHPERFRRRTPGAYGLVPQGGGDAAVHHRCPGEALTLALMSDITRLLSRELRYELEAPVSGLDWGRLPALPREPLQLSRVAPSTAATARLPAAERANGRAARARPH